MSQFSVKYAGAGCVVELMQGGRPLLAWVLEEQSGQLRLWSINKREMKLAAGRVLPWLGPSYGSVASRQEIQERLEQHRKRREELASGLDMLQIWELAQGEIRQADARWFAELVWPEPDADQVAAMGQAMLAQKTHFKFFAPVFEVYPEEQVLQRQEKQREEEARMELATVGAEIFRKLYEASRQRRVLPENERPGFEGEGGDIALALAELLKARIADPDAHDADGLWKLLIKALPSKMGQGGQPGQGSLTPAGASRLEDEPHLPLMLATAWGLVPEHYNFWLDRADYDPTDDWYAPYRNEIEEIVEAIDKFAQKMEAGELPEVERCENEVVSIDPDSTRDWDDAFSIGRTPDGGYRLTVALACPALGWPFAPAEEASLAPNGTKSGLDRAVFRRATSIYLPEAEYFMMPPGLARGCYSLEAGRLRPGLLLRLEFDAQGNMLCGEPRLAVVRVRANLTQKYCEALLKAENNAADEAEAGLAAMLKTGLELAEKLQAQRLENGAIITERPEINIVVKEGQGGLNVALERAEPVPLAQLLVSELMIAATLALTQWCTERGIPLLYRSQDVALPKEFSGVWRREEEIARVLKALPPSLLGLEPKPHAGLGVKFYSSFTAPIRRYPDLINESQVISWLQDGRPRLSKEELAALLPQLNSRLDQAGQIQRFRPRYWKLLFFQQQEQGRKGRLNYWNAVITEENNYFVGVMLEEAQLYLRGPRQLFGGRTMPGSPVRVRLGKINPLRNEIQIMEVLEE